jgi:hypothetical protein
MFQCQIQQAPVAEEGVGPRDAAKNAPDYRTDEFFTREAHRLCLRILGLSRAYGRATTTMPGRRRMNAARATRMRAEREDALTQKAAMIELIFPLNCWPSLQSQDASRTGAQVARRDALL